MSVLRDRLLNCFSVVFPELSPDQLLTASTTTLESWDSMAALTILAVLEEQFGLTIPPEDLEYLTGFEDTVDYMRSRLQETSGPE